MRTKKEKGEKREEGRKKKEEKGKAEPIGGAIEDELICLFDDRGACPETW